MPLPKLPTRPAAILDLNDTELDLLPPTAQAAKGKLANAPKTDHLAPALQARDVMQEEGTAGQRSSFKLPLTTTPAAMPQRRP
jgi:hypothetical protein